MQRVTTASVAVDGDVVGEIGPGLCVFVGVAEGDTATAAQRLATRLWQLRIFADDQGRMNRSAAELGHEVLVVSQFTLCADTSRGRRPSFVGAAPPEQAEGLVDEVVRHLVALGARVATGRFRTDMAVTLTNDGPATFILDA